MVVMHVVHDGGGGGGDGGAGGGNGHPCLIPNLAENASKIFQ